MDSVIEWLRSPEGEKWSEKRHEHVKLAVGYVVLVNDGDESNLLMPPVNLWPARRARR